MKCLILSKLFTTIDELDKPVSYTHLDVYKRQIVYNLRYQSTNIDGVGR